MPDFSIEKQYDTPIIGLDEVGRGPLAGPVISCGCIFNNYKDNVKYAKFIIDSKKLSPKKRQQSFKFIQSLIIKYSKDETCKVGLPKDNLKSRIDLIQNITNEDSLIKVVNNILELETDDEWFIRGVEGLKRGSPTSAFLIWEQCSRSGSLSLEEVFQFELDLAIQVTRHQDFTEGIRAIIIDKDNNPQWIYTKVEDVTKEWIEEHLHPAWNENPLKSLQN